VLPVFRDRCSVASSLYEPIDRQTVLPRESDSLNSDVAFDFDASAISVPTWLSV